MSSTVKKMVYGSLAVAIVVAILCIVDLAMGIPFGGLMVPDIIYLVCCLILGYMAFSIKREQS